MLDPAPNGYVVQGQAPFRHPLFQVAVAERVPQIPLDAQNDNHVLEVSPPEQSLEVLARRLTLPDPRMGVCNRSGGNGCCMNLTAL
jgi:hypothetical protein